MHAHSAFTAYIMLLIPDSSRKPRLLDYDL